MLADGIGNNEVCIRLGLPPDITEIKMRCGSVKSTKHRPLVKEMSSLISKILYLNKSKNAF